jgi:RNA polymerase sigma factor (sigma-70 family)
MDEINDKTTQKSPKTLNFSPKKQQPQVSNSIDDNEVLYEYYKLGYLVCMELLGNNKEEARELAHDVFEKITDKYKKGEIDRDLPKSYFRKTARNMIINKSRRRGRLARVFGMAINRGIEYISQKDTDEDSDFSSDQTGETIGTIDKEYETVEDKMTIENIMTITKNEDTLTQATIKLLYWDNLKWDDIVIALGEPRTTLWDKHNMFLKKIRKKLERTKR